MKAIVYTKYGPPDVLQLKDVEKPIPKDNQVLVKVHAASVNTLDLALRGPLLARVITGGLRKSKDPRLGVDLAGRVEAVSSTVTQFQPGDEVFGRERGAFAEYVCARKDTMVGGKYRLYFSPSTVTIRIEPALPSISSA